MSAIIGFLDQLLRVIEQLMPSPWIYLVIFLVIVVDSFLPILPSETAVITAGVFAAAQGVPNLALLIPIVIAAAIIGDHIAYALGRRASGQLHTSGARGRWARSLSRVEHGLAERGMSLIIAARFIPGGRTAVTTGAGATNYPPTRFAAYTMLGALLWTTYSVAVGYLGGTAFRGEPLRGLLLGVGIAVGVTVVLEAARYVLQRRRGAAAQVAPAAEPLPVGASWTPPQPSPTAHGRPALTCSTRD